MLALPTADAGFFGRLNDIYNAPEKISEIQQQYAEANEELSKQLEESLQTAEQYAAKQEELLAQNERLLEQNALLQSQIEQMQQQKESFQNKLIYSGVLIAAIIVAYIAAVRIWRYAAWRKHRNIGGRGISG